MNDLRTEFDSPNLPVVVGELGNGGPVTSGDMFEFRKAQEEGTRQIKNALFIKTTDFARPAELSPNTGHGHHWFGNATHQQFWTRKVTDPLWRGPDGSKLQITLKMPQTNRLHIVLQQNEWRSCRGQRRTYVCSREIEGADAQQTLTLDLSDFTSADGSPTSWAELDQLGLCAHFARRYEVSGPKVVGMGSNIASAVTRTGPVKARKSRCSLFLRIKSQVKQR